MAVILSARLELVNNDPTLEHVVTHLLWPSMAVILSALLELVNNDPTLEHCRNTSTMAFCGSDSVSSFIVNNDPTLEHVVTHLLWPSVAVILSARLELVNNDPTLEHVVTHLIGLLWR